MTTTDNIMVDNLKCGGCENTIKMTLKKMAGVEKVNINSENSEISVVHDETVTQAEIDIYGTDIGSKDPQNHRNER